MSINSDDSTNDLLDKSMALAARHLECARAEIARIYGPGHHHELVAALAQTAAETYNGELTRMVTMIPANGAWESLRLGACDEAVPEKVSVLPVVAWQRSLRDGTTPVCWPEREVDKFSYDAIRRVGSPTIYVDSNWCCSAFDTMEQWLAAIVMYQEYVDSF
jgi:hypothetical protein